MMARTSEMSTHLLGIEGMSTEDITALLDRAEALRPIVDGREPSSDALRGRVIANVFLEDSTRTRMSFALAAMRLGATTSDLTGAGSSVAKGESLIDTVRTIDAMGFDAIVIRCREAGGAMAVTPHVTCPIINAGDGAHEHPTQALLDALTLRQRFGRLEHLCVAIVGDLRNSRVARSNLHLLNAFGAEVFLVGPPELAPDAMATIVSGPGAVHVRRSLDEVLGQVDAVMMLRVQFERHDGTTLQPDYRGRFALTAARAGRLREDAVIMHPGPLNRGLEIDAQAADDPVRSVITAQVRNGVAVRMAVLEGVLASA